ncbi:MULTISPECIES: hypothetical protein [unclassified Coleofasciculus]|uniref:hypothetical protein n=1 Tax=unclassified Coleofasciculus TaxID=2692782 RepID=UPI0018825A0B|nr:MULTISPECIES: hypothetical protein [unclassified Coleofasciculus]MBE9126506.1 hypothetical protein [Coleofasciculus sp. LEGE 07081]MBE9149897.1 hypothetical protein [Coleofasciculus sp. LEGE 07092]
MIEISGLGWAIIKVIAGVGTLINFLGVPGLSAAGITSALAAIGSVVGMGMLAGIVMIAVGGVIVGKFCF